MPDGSRLQRKFFNTNTIQVNIVLELIRLQEVTNFVKKQSGKIGSQVRLLQVFPKRPLDETTKTLKDFGLGKQEALIVEIN